MRPLAVDIDGTLTGEDRVVDPRVLPVLGEWADRAPVVVATGKAYPYPVALCEFAGLPVRVIAENGGLAALADDDRLVSHGDRAAAERVVERYRAAGHPADWTGLELVNRWRETEMAVPAEGPVEVLRELAAEEGMRVFDTGFAYHVTSPDVDKGVALRAVADRLSTPVERFVAVGDSENDAGMLAAAGESYAVANADATAREAADRVTERAHAAGFLEAVERAGAGIGALD
jgi:phosphoglycolate phosphatase (TIGR01487 family)